MKISSKDGSKVMTVIASPGQGPDRSTEVSYTDTKVSAKPTMMVIGSISACRIHISYFFKNHEYFNAYR